MSYDYQNCLNYAVETAVEAAVKTATEKALSEGEAKGKAEGLSEGEAKKSLEIAKKMLVMGLSTEQIAQATGLSEEEIIKLKQSQTTILQAFPQDIIKVSAGFLLAGGQAHVKRSRCFTTSRP